MASTFKLQVPTDIHSLVQLLAKLGIICGPMKSAKITNDVVNIWFVAVKGTADVKRVSARLIRGVAVVCEGSPRRVYLDVRVQSHIGGWRDITDANYVAAGFEPPYKYDGSSYVALRLDIGRGEGEYWDAGSEAINADDTVVYHRLLEGDRERALAEARNRVEVFERSE